MAGNEAHRLGMVSVGQGNAGIGGTTTGRGDARHHLEGNAFGCQFFDFFATAAEDEGITSLQP